jgi:N-acyl-D-aspartate/D-glutamate deacylase
MPTPPRIFAIALFLTASLLRAQAPQLDLILHNGTLVDGSGAPAVKADVGILNDRIVFVGAPTGYTARRTIDATGLIITPGFIDPHTHTTADLSKSKTSQNAPYLMQGVTTVATGNDGSSPTDIGKTLAQWTAQGIGTNAVLFIGQGTVRREVMGMSDAKPTPDQMEQMKSLVARAMSEGAIGLSTGLYYTPGSYSSTEEVIELARVAARYHGIYDTHMRDESSYNIGLLASVDETIRIGREAKIPVMISHIKALGADVWGQSTQVIAHIDAARADGIDVIASQYPYDASGTSLVSALVPAWALANNQLHFNLTDPTTKPRTIAEMTANLKRRGGPESILITSTPDRTILGKTLATIAKERNQSPIDAAVAIILVHDASVASFNMKESDIIAFMRQPWVMTCSDGSEGHPRKYGTFPLKFRKYVFDQHVLTLEAAVHTSTELPAKTLGLTDRGLLKAGYFADILAFDPKTYNATATYTQPESFATGVRYLLVNGKLAIDNGTLNPTLAGRTLTHAR